VSQKTPPKNSPKKTPLDRIAAGEYEAASELFRESLTHIRESKRKMLEGSKQHPHKSAANAIASLDQIIARKNNAWGLLRPAKPAKARQALEDALELERELALWAEHQGIRL
jgi:hypothetical protein